MPLTQADRILLPHLNGKNDRAALQSRLAEAVRQGMTRLPEAQTESSGTEQIESTAARHVERMLRYLVRHAVLEADEA